MMRMSDCLPADWEIDFEDLGNVYARARIQSCNARLDVDGAPLLPLQLLRAGNDKEPNLMWDLRRAAPA
jgi:hypothetical protein